MVRYLQDLINASSGFTAIEYALIAALMAVAGDSRVCLSRHQPQQDLAKALPRSGSPIFSRIAIVLDARHTICFREGPMPPPVSPLRTRFRDCRRRGHLRQWGQRSGAVRGLGRAGGIRVSRVARDQVRDRLDQRSSKGCIPFHGGPAV
jgi:hypothetical protein